MFAPIMEHHTTNDQTAVRMVSVAEAARALGISSEAVRMRLRRKSLDGHRNDAGRWQVELVSTEPSSVGDATNGAADTSDGSPQTKIVDGVADLRAERDRLLGMLEATLAERRDQPPSVLTSLRRLMATVTDWLVERLRRRDAED
jgi:hypothetical protein